MVVCLVLLGLASILGAMATSFPLLFASHSRRHRFRGVFPSTRPDQRPGLQRQVTVGHTLAGAMTGNLLGASPRVDRRFPGLARRAVLGGLVIVASVANGGFRGAALTRPPTMSALKHGYRTIFANPNARVCYTAVFIEGCCVLGLFPFIAAFLFDLGETSLSIAGIVIAGFAVGGLFYTMTVSRFLPRIGVSGMMIVGGALVGLQLAIIAFGPSWKLQASTFVYGLGFLHVLPGCRCLPATVVEARATAVAAFVLLLHGPDHRSDRLVLTSECRQNHDVATGHHLALGFCALLRR
jgi:hypothetical protein